MSPGSNENHTLHFDGPTIPWYGYVIVTFAGLVAIGVLAEVIYLAKCAAQHFLS